MKSLQLFFSTMVILFYLIAANLTFALGTESQQQKPLYAKDKPEWDTRQVRPDPTIILFTFNFPSICRTKALWRQNSSGEQHERKKTLPQKSEVKTC
jgi:hypothetical protein